MSHPNKDPLILVLPNSNSSQPIKIQGNRIRVAGARNYTTIAVHDPGSSLPTPVTIANNVCENAVNCVDAAAASTHVRTLTLSGNLAH
jgi:hypothetical protein